MLKIFLLTRDHTPLADEHSEMLKRMQLIMQDDNSIDLNCTMDGAHALIIQEKISFKNFRYIADLKADPILKKYAHKTFTYNIDDGATGLIKGIYTCLHKKRFDPRFHAVIPYPGFPNELIFKEELAIKPAFLATWRGNPSSNRIRVKLVKLFSNDKDCDIQTTSSWFNHSLEEKQLYKKSMYNAKFILCPAGLAPVTFRIYESMALGKCPIIIADQFLRPPGPDWETFSISIPESKISSLKKVLKKNEHLYEDLGNKAYQAWETFFSSNIPNYYTQQLINLIKASPPCSLQSEHKRWDSFRMYYNNDWTFLQRLLSKVKKTLKVI